MNFILFILLLLFIIYLIFDFIELCFIIKNKLKGEK